MFTVYACTLHVTLGPDSLSSQAASQLSRNFLLRRTSESLAAVQPRQAGCFCLGCVSRCWPLGGCGMQMMGILGVFLGGTVHCMARMDERWDAAKYIRARVVLLTALSVATGRWLSAGCTTCGCRGGDTRAAWWRPGVGESLSALGASAGLLLQPMTPGIAPGVASACASTELLQRPQQ